MSSEMTDEVILVVGNTHTGQRDSGYSVVSRTVRASRRRAGRPAFVVPRDEDTGKLHDLEVYVSRHLSPRPYGKAGIWKMSCRAEIRTGFGKSDRPGS
jgi:hypothetical protein